MSYTISYTHNLGEVAIPCKAGEVASILRNMVALALQGHKFCNVQIKGGK